MQLGVEPFSIGFVFLGSSSVHREKKRAVNKSGHFRFFAMVARKKKRCGVGV